MNITFLRIEKNKKTKWCRAIIELPADDLTALRAMVDGKDVKIKDAVNVKDFTKYIEYK